MKCYSANLSLFVGGALSLAAGWPLAAQESIIFSRPTDGVTEKANSFMEQQPHKAPSRQNAPSSIFNGKPKADFDVLPGAQKSKPLSAEEVRQMQKNLDNQRNWTLMTPEEFMNVPTAAKIMGLPDPDQNLSADERYMKRQDQQRNASATNGMSRARYFGADEDSSLAPWSDKKKKDREATAELGQGRSTAKLSPLEAEQQKRWAESPWVNAFNLPAPTPKADKEQQAGMERFRAMMQSPQAERTELPTTASGFQPSAARVADQKLQALPGYNPAGSSYQPVHETASRPMGITPLPTVTGFTPPSGNAPKQKPKPLVQAPPWARDNKNSANATPEPGTFLQRKF